jgi:hypothetical protein
MAVVSVPKVRPIPLMLTSSGALLSNQALPSEFETKYRAREDCGYLI